MHTWDAASSRHETAPPPPIRFSFLEIAPFPDVINAIWLKPMRPSQPPFNCCLRLSLRLDLSRTRPQGLPRVPRRDWIIKRMPFIISYVAQINIYMKHEKEFNEIYTYVTLYVNKITHRFNNNNLNRVIIYDLMPSKIG